MRTSWGHALAVALAAAFGALAPAAPSTWAGDGPRGIPAEAISEANSEPAQDLQAIAEAERVLADVEQRLPPDHPDVQAAKHALTLLYIKADRRALLRGLYARFVGLYEAALGPDHWRVASEFERLARAYQDEGRLDESEAALERAQAIRKGQGSRSASQLDDPSAGLADLEAERGNDTLAEAHLKRQLAESERLADRDETAVLLPLDQLARFYRQRGRHAEALPYLKRLLALVERLRGPDHPDLGLYLEQLAAGHLALGESSLAEPYARRALVIRETNLGSRHPDTGRALLALAEVHLRQRRLADAEPLLQKALAIGEATAGLDLGMPAYKLANLYLAQRRIDLAKPMLERYLGRYKSRYDDLLHAEETPVATALATLGLLAMREGKWEEARGHLLESTQIVVRQTERGAAARPAQGVAEVASALDRGGRSIFTGFVQATHRAPLPEDAAEPLRRVHSTFVAAQWAQGSRAANALALLAERLAGGDARRAGLVRKRQDALFEWQALSERLRLARAGAAGSVNGGGEELIVARLAAIERSRTEIERALRTEFPEYAALARPTPLTVARVQELLSPNEVLVLILDAPGPPLVDASDGSARSVFVWIVPKSGEPRWVRGDRGFLDLDVAALRCGLDAAAWTGDGERDCQELLRATSYSRQDAMSGKPLPFDVFTAHALYKDLFTGTEHLLRNADGTGKHLVVVASGPLQQLPLGVLVTEPPPPDADPTRPGGLAKVQWLARRHPVTVLPSVASLEALRSSPRPSAGSRNPYLGIGNPLLGGDPANAGEGMEAGLAKRMQTCAEAVKIQSFLAAASGFASLGSDVRPAAPGGSETAAHVATLAPVPRTAGLICDVASRLGAGEPDLLLGSRASEKVLRELDASGRLSTYAVVNFATHGVLAGDIEGMAEPGLVLTPPPETAAVPDDDGYLAASEVASLKLDADWVILSACNTAAAGAKDAEALSGLARAFFYAGARALLVSHWSVVDRAAVELVTGAIAELSKEPAIGRGEAVRRAMVALAGAAGGAHSHPSFWAPFVLVGEGGN